MLKKNELHKQTSKQINKLHVWVTQIVRHSHFPVRGSVVIASGSPSVVHGSRKSPRHSQGICKIDIIFIIVVRLSFAFFFTVLTFGLVLQSQCCLKVLAP